MKSTEDIEIREGDLYRMDGTSGKEDKLVLVISNENDEPYSRSVPVQVLVAEKKAKDLFSLPFLDEHDNLWFCHANYSPYFQKHYLVAKAKKVGKASESVVELARMCCARRFTDDPDFYRGLVEEVIRYNTEMKELTGSSMIMTHLHAPKKAKTQTEKPQPEKSEEKKPKKQKHKPVTTVSLKDGISQIMKNKGFVRNWPTENLILYLDLCDTYKLDAVGKAMGWKSPLQSASYNQKVIRKELIDRGIHPDCRHDVKVKTEKELLNPENPPKRTRPIPFYAPKQWDRFTLSQFCSDLDTYSMACIQRMYQLDEPLSLKWIDAIRSENLSKNLHQAVTPPTIITTDREVWYTSNTGHAYG